MKCLPTSKVSQAQGNILHDWHAEVLTIRAFNRFVLDECKVLAQGCSSEFLRWRTIDEIASSYCRDDTRAGEPGGQGSEWRGQPFTWREDVLLHMYCSEAPCGDASMELIMEAQEDATPWELPLTNPSVPLPTTDPSTSLPGRAYFSQLGVVRRKPARSDAPPTLSKSCSDKLALRQCISLLSSITALLVDPRHVYIHTLVLPESRYSESACRRSFSSCPIDGRMRSMASAEEQEERLKGEGEAPYTFRPFTVKTTSSEFAFSQRAATQATANNANQHAATNEQNRPAAQKVSASNISAAWTRSGLEETTLGGILQGRKQSAADARGASFASRRRIWGLAVEVADLLLPQAGEDNEEGEEGEGEAMNTSAIADIRRALTAETYGEMKGCALLEPRRRAKHRARAEALKGWVRNLGDESFNL
ncbi:adenosine deaminase/editase [Daldinia vernicosa]|uniref:adenosine deaminase/editase n=1 Tax=Daldinia vernicosa TaxID=114800 RepID=UPI0020077670|nr:adenosine deaminase/editase [Daldinia vernicosa]KAI0848412.1 adenosine deaminase/editase [Daldinia vernicosa]